MGWLFCSPTRSDLIAHIKRDVATSTNLTPVGFSTVGNFLYALVDVHKTPTRPAYKTILVFKMQGSSSSDSPHYRWGYKGMDEAMEPYVYTCPLKFLDASTNNHPSAVQWREDCRAEHTRKASRAKSTKLFKIGETYTFQDAPNSPWFNLQGKVFQLATYGGKPRWRSVRTGAFIKASKNWPVINGYNAKPANP